VTTYPWQWLAMLLGGAVALWVLVSPIIWLLKRSVDNDWPVGPTVAAFVIYVVVALIIVLWVLENFGLVVLDR
jgi:hypothetical protein